MHCIGRDGGVMAYSRTLGVGVNDTGIDSYFGVNGPVTVPGVCGNLCVAAAACLGLQYTLDNSFVSTPLMVCDTSACSEITGVSASRVLYDDNGREVAHEFEGDDTVVNCLLRR